MKLTFQKGLPPSQSQPSTPLDSQVSEKEKLRKVLEEASILHVFDILWEEDVTVQSLQEGIFSDDDLKNLGIKLRPRIILLDLKKC